MRLRNQNKFIWSILELIEDKVKSDCVVRGERFEDSADALVVRALSCVTMHARRTTKTSPESGRT